MAIMAAVGFEPTPPERLEPKSSALDRSATLPLYYPSQITPQQSVTHLQQLFLGHISVELQASQPLLVKSLDLVYELFNVVRFSPRVADSNFQLGFS